MFQALAWPSLYKLRFEVLDWAVDVIERGLASTGTFGAAALLGGFKGRFDDAEAFGRGIEGVGEIGRPTAPERLSCHIGLSMAAIARQQPTEIHAAVLAANRCGGLAAFGDALTSAILATLEVETNPAAPERPRHAEQLIASRANPALAADVLANLALYYARSATRPTPSQTAAKRSALHGFTAPTSASTPHTPCSPKSPRLARSTILSPC